MESKCPPIYEVQSHPHPEILTGECLEEIHQTAEMLYSTITTVNTEETHLHSVQLHHMRVVVEPIAICSDLVLPEALLDSTIASRVGFIAAKIEKMLIRGVACRLPLDLSAKALRCSAVVTDIASISPVAVSSVRTSVVLKVLVMPADAVAIANHKSSLYILHMQPLSLMLEAEAYADVVDQHYQTVMRSHSPRLLRQTPLHYVTHIISLV